MQTACSRRRKRCQSVQNEARANKLTASIQRYMQAAAPQCTCCSMQVLLGPYQHVAHTPCSDTISIDPACLTSPGASCQWVLDMVTVAAAAAAAAAAVVVHMQPQGAQDLGCQHIPTRTQSQSAGSKPPPVPVTMPPFAGPTKDTAGSFAWTRATHPSCWLPWHPWRLRYDRAARLSVQYTLCLPEEAGRWTTCGVGDKGSSRRERAVLRKGRGCASLTCEAYTWGDMWAFNHSLP
jgi:hypothetical protein